VPCPLAHCCLSQRSVATLAGLFLAAIALRPQIVGIGPLLPAIQTGKCKGQDARTRFRLGVAAPFLWGRLRPR
jgi:hypothetical protein